MLLYGANKTVVVKNSIELCDHFYIPHPNKKNLSQKLYTVGFAHK